MSMNFDINMNRLKTDYTSLFSGMSGGSGSGGISSMLSDYASIKNGSYRKLMKAYYSEAGSESAKKSSSKSRTGKGGYTAEDMIADKIKWQRRTETKESKDLTQMKSATDNLVKSMDKLGARGEDSVFTKKALTSTDENGVESVNYDYDKEAIYSAVSDFVSSYNSVLQSSWTVGNSTISSRVNSMQKETQANKEQLSQLGITIKADNTLSINKETFLKANMENAANLFAKGGSYTRDLATSASMIKQNANYEQLRANTYTFDGNFNSAYNSGSSFSSSL